MCLFFLCVTGLNAAYAQQVTVSGVVTDSKKLPIPAASVLLKGTQQGTTTDLNGKFTIKASVGQTLTFKSVGFTDKDVTVGTSRTINVTLDETNSQLNEVVVIGYGTQKKANVSGALSSMRNTNLDERPITRVDQALVGQLAGVNVKQNSGLPGKAFSVQVRGTASISAGNEPLYVIDGFPLALNSSNASTGNYSQGNPLDNINPADIESIDVLKDAAAAAIYGSRATNGVVIITTKHGKSGKPKISFNNSFGYNAASKQLDMLNGDEWIARATEIINATYLARTASVGGTAADNTDTRRINVNKTLPANQQIGPGQISTSYMLDPRWAIPGHPGLTDHNWQKLIERNGLMQNSQLTASGGNDYVSYYVSGAYQDQNSFIKNTGYKQYSVRANVDVNVSKKLKIGFNVAPTYSVTNDPGVEGKDNIFHQALSMSPIQEDSVGNYPNIGKNATYSWSNSTNGPLGKLENNIGINKRYRTLATAYGQYEIIDGLTFKSSVNFDNTDNQSNSYVPYITTGSLASRTFTGSNNLLAATSGSYSSYKRQTFVNENTLTYAKTFNSVHSLNFLLGQSYNYDRFDAASIKSNGGYNNASVQTLSAAAGVTGTTTGTLNVLISYFGRAQYSYKDKYLLSASLRTDGSSRFGSNTKFGWFPAASVAWRVTQEDFMKSVKTISDLKLRVSYGVNGNNGIGDYSTIPQIGGTNYVFGGTQAVAIGQAPSNVVNPNLKWEKSRTYDFGLDFGLFNNRLTGSFDYYNKRSTDLLLNVPVLETTGFNNLQTNIGAVNGVGQELELTSRNITGAFEWSTTFNIAHNSNKITALGPGQTQIIIPNSLNVSDAILRVGQSLNSVYVLKYNGFLTAADIAANYPKYGPEAPGDPKFEDYNHDGQITEADKQIVGHPNPSFTAGLTNTFRYKNFDLSILIQGQSGGVIYSELARALSRPGQGFTDNTPRIFVDRWYSETNTGSGRFGKAYSTYNSPITATQDAVYSTNYYRIRDITLGYNLKNLIKTGVVQGARIYMSMENFFGADKYYGGLNPDAANIAVSSNSNYAQSGDYGGLPLAKSLIFGVNFTF